MKLHFDPHLPHQRAAIDAVLKPWRGQPFVTMAEALAAGRAMGVVANRLDLDDAELRARVAAAQRAAGLEGGEAWPEGAAPELSVEMETGTGKTYVYLRTVLELARRHGVRKVVVVVPSVAVREGVLATLRSTAEHFAAWFPGLRIRAFAYDGARLSRLRSFATSSQVEIMVLTLDAFNKASNRMRRPHDGFGGRTPLQLLQATRPLVVLDEPQRMGSPRARAALADLAPLCTLRYSATHRRPVGLVHRLTPRQAHQQGLVKRIEVAAPAAGLVDDDARISAQLRATIELHLRRQERLRARGIKVLSLLFVPRVADWVEEDGRVRVLFGRHFDALKAGVEGFAERSAEQVSAAYFAVQRRGGSVRAVDSRTGRSAADEDAYALIMRDKERLLSLDEPVSFVVSHSALREGWDNPNVFQICTMASSRSSIKKRQEVGRGVRLAVDQRGRRVMDPAVDVLTVVANDSYEAYVAGLQREDAQEVGAREVGPAPRPVAERDAGAEPEPAEGRAGWRSLDVERLRADALAVVGSWSMLEGDSRGAAVERPRGGGRGAGEVEQVGEPAGAVVDDPMGAVVDLLLRRSPPALVGRDTRARVLEAAERVRGSGSWGAIDLAVAAIVGALDRQWPSDRAERVERDRARLGSGRRDR